jgi:putative oxidoreductase
MSNILSPFTEKAYALLRIVSGAMFACHGLQKLFGMLGGQQAAMGSQQWIGGVIELGGGVLIAIGLFTSLAAFLASGMMAVAFFQFHWKFGGESFLPILNKGELAALYCFVFLYIACKGGGHWSFDARRPAS